MAASVWLTRAFWMPGGYVVGFDTYAYSGPNVEVTAAAIRDWRLPFVNQYIFAGVPHLGNPQAAALYPSHLLAQVFDTNRAMGLAVTLHVVLFGIGMLALARRLRFGQIGATVAAVVTVAAGASLTKTVQYEQIQVLAWTPLLLTTIHATLTSPRRWESTAALAAVTSAVLLAGHPQLVYQAIIAAAVAAVGFVVGLANAEERWRRLAHVALGAALGALIALPQLVASLFATADSAISGGRTLAELEAPGLALEPAYTARSLLGTVQDRDPAAFAGGFETIGFLGVVVAIVSVVGVVETIGNRRSRPWAIAFAILGVVALVWSFGPATVVFDVAYRVIPGFDLARGSARWITVVVMLVALFAGAGVDALARGAGRRHAAAAAGGTLVVVGLIALGPLVTADRRSAAIWAVTATVVVALIVANGTIESRTRSTIARTTAVAAIALGAIELGAMSLPSIPNALREPTPFTEHATDTTRWLATQTAGSTIALTNDGEPAAYQMPGLRPNTNVFAGVTSPDGYDGGVQVTKRWADALRRFTPDPAIELPLRNSLQIPLDTAAMARLGVRFVLIDQDRPADEFIPGWEGPLATDATFAVYENPDWIGDAVLWSRAEPANDAADVLRERPATVGEVALVDDDTAALECSDHAAGGGDDACAPSGVELEVRTPEHLVIETSSPRTTVLSVARQALPGWSVEIDGEPADEVLVDGLFLGVTVPAGDHVVEWRYASPWFAWTVLVSGLAIAATIAMVGLAIVRGRAESSSARVDPSIDT